MKKVLIKNNKVVEVVNAEFLTHPDAGTWADCNNDDVKIGWTYDANTQNATAPVEEELSVKIKRSNAYKKIATYGDIIDALFKKEAGDSTEWDAIATQRQQVKTDIPKE
jgi:hypothetical protein